MPWTRGASTVASLVLAGAPGSSGVSTILLRKKPLAFAIAYLGNPCARPRAAPSTCEAEEPRGELPHPSLLSPEALCLCTAHGEEVQEGRSVVRTQRGWRRCRAVILGGSVCEERCPSHSDQSAYVLYLIRKKNHLADNLHGVRFLLRFYLVSFRLMLSFDFAHFIIGVLGQEFYVIHSFSIRSFLASGPIAFLFYLVKRT